MNQLTKFFDSRFVQRGRSLYRNGAVVQLSFDRNKKLINAQVQGTQASPYDVSVFLDKSNEPTRALCSCPVTINCKHAVASILAHHASLAHGHDEHGHTEFLARQWMERWQATQTEPAPEHFTDSSWDKPRTRIYSLSPLKQSGDWGVGVSVTLLDAPRTASGQFNKGRRAETEHHFNSSLELSSMDKDIQAMGSARLQADRGRYTHDTGRYELTGHFGQLMLELCINTGRCFLQADRRQPLTIGTSRALTIDWQPESGNRLRMVPAIAGLKHCWVMNTDQPWWIDPISITAGPIDTVLSGTQLALLLEAPAMSESHLQELSDWQSHSPPNEQINAQTNTQTRAQTNKQNKINATDLLPLPPVKLEPLIDVQPSPVLLLHSPDNNAHVDSWELALLMRYDTVVLQCKLDEGAVITRVVDEHDETVRIRRNYELETLIFFETMKRTSNMLPRMQEDTGKLAPTFEAVGNTPTERFSAYVKLVQQREAFERDEWEFIVLPPVHVEPLRPNNFDGLVERADDGSPGWFDLSLGIVLNGERYDLMQQVAEYIERGGGDKPLFAETSDGRFMQVDAALVKPIAEVLQELGTPAIQDGKVRLSRMRALALQNLDDVLIDEGFNTAWRGTSEPFKFAKRLRELANVDTSEFDQTPIPRGLKATLRPYQRTGLGWLNALASSNVCGILADDMGLGKTLQTLAHILWLRQSRRLKGPVLIVVPTSLLLNWAREAEQFTPRLKVRIWHGKERHDTPLDAIDPPAHLVVITSYGLALRDNELLAAHGFDMLVLDEAQQIRNPLAKTTRAIKSLPIERRLCLSGTPLENHLGELWSQFDFLMPDLLGDAKRFNTHYRIPIEKHGNTERQHRLASAVKPFLLRRRKEEVATDLPPMTEMLREVHLGTAQAKLYESIRASMQKRVRKALQSKGLAQSHVTVLDALLKLRQCCCHPELVKLDSAKRAVDSAKTTLALDMIDELIAEGRRILLFSSFTSMLDILEGELKARGHRWVKLTGRTRKRDEVIDAFQRGDVPLFLISLKAGGVGLNLTAADTVIHYDPWWNPAAEAQASARAHRIGQNKPVFVYKLVATNTVEQRIVLMQQRKQELANTMIESGDGTSLASISVEETLALFDAD